MICAEEDKNPTLVEHENEFVHSQFLVGRNPYGGHKSRLLDSSAYKYTSQGGQLKVSKASVVATTIPLFSFFFYKWKERGPLLKFQSYCLILYRLTLMLCLSLLWRSWRFYIVGWFLFIGVHYSFLSNDFRWLHDSYWPMMLCWYLFQLFIDFEVFGDTMWLQGCA